MVSKLQLVVFSLEREHYGLDTTKVKEIARMEEVTPIPRVPSYIEGVLNLRGQILPIVCLRKRLALPPRQETTTTRIVIVDAEDLKVGLIVDAVTEVSDITNAVVTPAPHLATSSFVTGVCQHGEALVSLLDPVQLFFTDATTGVK